IAVGGLVETRHDPQQGRLAHAVGSYDTDLRPVQEREGDVVEDDLLPVRLADVAQREHVLSHGSNPTAGGPIRPNRPTARGPAQAAGIGSPSLVSAGPHGSSPWLSSLTTGS